MMGRLITDGLMAASTLGSGMVASQMGVASLFSPQVSIIPSQGLVASHLADMKDVWLPDHLLASHACLAENRHEIVVLPSCGHQAMRRVRVP